MTTAHFVRGASAQQIADFALADLFRGIALDSIQADAARTTLLNFAAQEVRMPLGAASGSPWDRIVALYTEREKALLLLLRSDADRVTFTANATALRRKIEAARPPNA